jgi:alkyldihydroxyacetonephosphate synthase
MQGKINLGRAHVAACKPIHVNEEQEQDFNRVVEIIQESQAGRIFVSDYHVAASARLLGVKMQVARKAFKDIGAESFPDAQFLGSSAIIPSLPTGRCELLSIVLHISCLLSIHVRRSRPEWAEWLHRRNTETCEDVNETKEVAMLVSALQKLFDEADCSVDRAFSMLKEKRFMRPKARHIFEISRGVNSRIPASLLLASISMRYPEHQIRQSNKKLYDGVGQIILSSDETLGFWGFSDSRFVVLTGDDDSHFVTLDGSRYSLKGKRLVMLLSFIEAELGLTIDPLMEAFPSTAAVASPSAFSNEDISLLKAVVHEVSTTTVERIRHGSGHCQEDIFLIRSGASMRVPDAVVWPESDDELAVIVKLAKEQQWCLIPFGGGTNVSKATRCPSVEVEPRPIISLDMRKMNKVLYVDEENGLAHVQAGITGLQLEQEMGSRGYTVGHEPDSIEFSTLGGWIATKASGMKRNKYGNIEDIVKGVTVVGPNGTLHHGDERSAWGRESCGIDVCSLFLGSEGCLGVIASAVVRIWPVAPVKAYDGILFSDFAEGLRFVRMLTDHGNGMMPVSVRLLDNEHFRLGLALRPEGGGSVASLANALYRWWNHIDPARVVCVTIMYEGTQRQVYLQKEFVSRVSARCGGNHLGAHAGKAGYDLTFMIAYLRDFAMTYHLLGESFETFVPWSKVSDVISATKARIRKEHSDRCLPGKPFIGCRVTQLYHEGACVYFYFCMSFDSVPNASTVYSDIEHAARSTILSNGGSLSHHHGIGKARSRFLQCIDSEPLRLAIQSIKQGIDPDNVFGARNGSFAVDSVSQN